MKEPEFIADANKSKLGVDPVTEEVEEIVGSLFKLQLPRLTGHRVDWDFPQPGFPRSWPAMSMA
jgi:hypothetical protein